MTGINHECRKSVLDALFNAHRHQAPGVSTRTLNAVAKQPDGEVERTLSDFKSKGWIAQKKVGRSDLNRLTTDGLSLFHT